jgi:hypothetical protein
MRGGGTGAYIQPEDHRSVGRGVVSFHQPVVQVGVRDVEVSGVLIRGQRARPTRQRLQEKEREVSE